MYFITTKRMLEVCFSAHPNIQYRTFYYNIKCWVMLISTAQHSVWIHNFICATNIENEIMRLKNMSYFILNCFNARAN